jgi:hypothetical protein
VDKHVVTPGKDAADLQRDGQGTLAWEAGEYAAEFGFPLNSGDSQDLAAKPGDRLHFNLVYADAFTADLAGTQFGGIFSASADDAAGWGYLVLADKVGTEAPAPEPEWLVKLFPRTGEPDEFAHRLRRLEATRPSPWSAPSPGCRP